MFFLRDGLYFEDGYLKEHDIFVPHAYTEELDRYYSYLEGTVSSGAKPRLRIPDEYKAFIRGLEAVRKPRFSQVCTTLLGFSAETIDDILARISWARDASLADGRDHEFTMTFPNLDLGLTISVSSTERPDQIGRLKNYCEMKMYQLKLSKWIHVAICDSGPERKYDFALFNKQWAFDSKLEQVLDAFRRNKLKQFFASGNKIERNDPCPCNGGLKYKKCCALRYSI